MMDETEVLADRYRQLYDGMITKDQTLLDEVLDDVFALAHMTGLRQSKKVFIVAVEDGTMNYFSAQHQSIQVSVQQGKASLVGQSLVRAAVFGGGQHTWRLQLSCKLVQKDGNWRIAEAQASTY
jgi:hypothetical protein